MYFPFIAVLFPIFLYLSLPIFLERYTNHKPQNQYLLIIACFLWFISWYIPSPEIQGMQTGFFTHFIGGGIFTGFLWLYLWKHLDLKIHWFWEGLGLYFFVSGLGVAVKLVEYVAHNTGYLIEGSEDAWLDFIANTSGAALFWLIYRASLAFNKKHV